MKGVIRLKEESFKAWLARGQEVELQDVEMTHTSLGPISLMQRNKSAMVVPQGWMTFTLSSSRLWVF